MSVDKQSICIGYTRGSMSQFLKQLSWRRERRCVTGGWCDRGACLQH